VLRRHEFIAEIEELKKEVRELKERVRRWEEGIGIGITLLFCALTPIAFLSAPVMGIVCAAAAVCCGYGLYRRRWR